MVANRLAEKFFQSLFELTQGKDYPTTIGRLAEILDWAKEFYEQYYHKVSTLENFRRSKDEIYNPEALNDLITVFGQERLKIFFEKNAHSPNYFLEKYSAVTKKDYHEEFYSTN